MGRNKNRDRSQPDKSGNNESGKPATDQTATDKTATGKTTPPASDDQLALSEWSERKRAVWRSFPGPRLLDVPLRVTIDRIAYAELIAHSKSALDTEVCGVLVGEAFEDDEGSFVQVKDIIRGEAADQSGTHVTYTQETWNRIHKAMEDRFPKLLIVGWYHSHPGYGVEFSEMDRFIQKNFFSGATQIGFVIDPIGGDAGLCVNADDEIKYINRFWIEGREQRAWVPPSRADSATPAGQLDAALQERLKAVEVRLEQTIRAFDEMRTTIYRFVLSVGMMIGIAVIFAIGYAIYSNYMRSGGPPALRSYAQIPIKIGDKVVLLGVDVIGWQVPIEAAEPEKKDQQSSSQPAGNDNASTSGQSERQEGQ
jgi:proteasome lid subunit RPN8/RPN11